MSILAYCRPLSTPRTQRHTAWRPGDVVFDSTSHRWPNPFFAREVSLASPFDAYQPTSFEARWAAETSPTRDEGFEVTGLASRPAWFRSLGLIPAELGAALAPR